MKINKRLFYPALAAVLIIGLLGAGLWFVQPALAVHTLGDAPSYCTLTNRVFLEDLGNGELLFGETWRCADQEVADITGYCVADVFVLVLEIDGVEEDFEEIGIQPVSLECSEPEPEFIAPALWLMALCEPNDGFSDDGWMSWDGDPQGTLYVAASAEGPWYATEFTQSPYIMNADHLNGLAAWMGVADWHDLWFKNSPEGQPVHVGTAVAERNANMAAYCGE